MSGGQLHLANESTKMGDSNYPKSTRSRLVSAASGLSTNHRTLNHRLSQHFNSKLTSPHTVLSPSNGGKHRLFSALATNRASEIINLQRDSNQGVLNNNSES